MSIVIAKVRPPSRSHANETKFIELHKQTEHKLEVISKLYGGYLAVIAQAGKNGRLDASRIFIVEVCCGAGVHLTLENPNNEVPGTALLACHHARAVQRTFSDTHVSVRLIDSDRQACSKLALRAAEYCDRHLSHPEVVDVRIIDREFESQIRPILAETQASKGRYRIGPGSGARENCGFSPMKADGRSTHAKEPIYRIADRPNPRRV
jgi:hypothetical protein